MTQGDFINQVKIGTYLYIPGQKKIIQVTRIFPPYAPAYAEWIENDKKKAAIYSEVQIVPEETLAKLIKKKNEKNSSNNE